MKSMNYLFSFLMVMMHGLAEAKKPYPAVIIVPVADGLGSPIKTFFPEKKTFNAYAQLPLCGGMPLASSSCPRLHQFLFNELVTVIKERDQEVLIKISNCFYTTPTTNTPQCAYWTLKKNIIPLKKLTINSIDLNKFPPSISFEQPASLYNEQVVTLIKPWHDATTGYTFSAGTRFLKVIEQEEKKTSVLVYIYNAKENNFATVAIPNSHIVITHRSTPEKKIELFIGILKQWAHPDGGSIPYVWGGCSFIATTDKPFTEIGTPENSYYEINSFNQVPKPGLDCSNLVLRAAQQAGIPFFFKNSYTIAAYLKPIKSGQSLSVGDIIWIPGHVLVVANTKKNTVIEARGYKYRGQGKIQEIPLNNVFKKINSFEQLTAAGNAQQPLERLGDDGSVVETIKNFKLLSMRSIMEQ